MKTNTGGRRLASYDAELHAAAKRMGLTPWAIRLRLRTMPRDVALRAPRLTGGTSVAGHQYRFATAEALRGMVAAAILGALPEAGWVTSSALIERAGVTRKRFRTAIAALMTEGRVERREAPDHRPEPRLHRWLYARARSA